MNIQPDRADVTAVEIPSCETGDMTMSQFRFCNVLEKFRGDVQARQIMDLRFGIGIPAGTHTYIGQLFGLEIL